MKCSFRRRISFPHAARTKTLVEREGVRCITVSGDIGEEVHEENDQFLLPRHAKDVRGKAEDAAAMAVEVGIEVVGHRVRPARAALEKGHEVTCVEQDRRRFHVTEGGVVVIPKGMKVA